MKYITVIMFLLLAGCNDDHNLAMDVKDKYPGIETITGLPDDHILIRKPDGSVWLHTTYSNALSKTNPATQVFPPTLKE